jgi:hypothetical protein
VVVQQGNSWDAPSPLPPPGAAWPPAPDSWQEDDPWNLSSVPEEYGYPHLMLAMDPPANNQ